MASAAATQLINPQTLLSNSNKLLFSTHHPTFNNSLSLSYNFINGNHSHIHSTKPFPSHRSLPVMIKSSLPGKSGVASPDGDDDEEGVSLGTMKLPLDTNIPRFEILLFQWANSLNQGAQLPLPVPMKVDKIEGGVRLGFVEIEDGKTQVQVYIDCQVYSDPPMFRATRKGVLKDKVPPGEPRIMKSLLAALKKSVEIASV